MSTNPTSPDQARPLGQPAPGFAARSPQAAPLSIGIVVPVFNESAILEGALKRLRQVAGTFPVVVADGGSTDGSARIAQRFFHTEVCTEPNRGLQMNRGARCLVNDVLLFLHADSQLPVGFAEHIQTALQDTRVTGGSFRLAFDDPHAMLRFYAWFTRFPGRFFHFGDQAFFVRREIFQNMGGFHSLPFLEDLDFLRRLGHYGRFAVLAVPVVTSARRFQKRGVIRQQLLNILLLGLFELGVSAQRLARLYPHIRSGSYPGEWPTRPFGVIQKTD